MVSNPGSSNIAFLSGNNDGTFAPAVPGRHNSTLIGIADFDGNRIADRGLGNRSNSNFTILLGLGAGIYTQPYEINLGQATAVNPTGGIAIADFNNDGLLDFVGTNTTFSDISILPQR